MLGHREQQEEYGRESLQLAEAAREELEKGIPVRRLGEVDDIAWAVVYLASEEAGYVTGHTLNVSGGLYI